MNPLAPRWQVLGLVLSSFLGIGILVTPSIAILNTTQDRRDRLESQLLERVEKIEGNLLAADTDIVNNVINLIAQLESRMDARVKRAEDRLGRIFTEIRDDNIRREARIFSAMIGMCPPRADPAKIPPQEP